MLIPGGTHLDCRHDACPRGWTLVMMLALFAGWMLASGLGQAWVTLMMLALFGANAYLDNSHDAGTKPGTCLDEVHDALTMVAFLMLAHGLGQTWMMLMMLALLMLTQGLGQT